MKNVREYEGYQRGNLHRAILTAPAAPRGVHGADECHCVSLCLAGWKDEEGFPANVLSMLQQEILEQAVSTILLTFSKRKDVCLPSVSLHSV